MGYSLVILCGNGNWPIVVDLPITNGNFPSQTVSLPEDI